VELSNYEKYLKYRRPEGFEFQYSGDKTYVVEASLLRFFALGGCTPPSRNAAVLLSAPSPLSSRFADPNLSRYHSYVWIPDGQGGYNSGTVTGTTKVTSTVDNKVRLLSASPLSHLALFLHNDCVQRCKPTFHAAEIPL